MSKKLFLGLLGLVLLVTTLSIGLPGITTDHTAAMYEVTVTNLTAGQIISPAVVATHNGAFDPLFTLGSPDLPPGTSPLSKLDLGPFEVHSMV